MSPTRLMQQLMQDDNFKAFVEHPKVQELFRDPDFRETARTRDFAKILAHPKFHASMQDPELASLMAKVQALSFFRR